MPELVIDGKLARALSVLGGRSLLKTGELLAGNMAPVLGGEMKSDATGSVIKVKNQELKIKPMPGKPVFKGKYYAYQKGELVLQGPAHLLEKAKASLTSIARERKHYLLARKDALEEYGLDEEFVLGVDKKVSELEVSK